MMKTSPLLRNLSVQLLFLKNSTTTTRVFSCTNHRNLSTNGDVSINTNNKPIIVTLFPGNGVGPVVARSVKEVLSMAQVPIRWEEHYVGDVVDSTTQSYLTRESLDSVLRNGVGLKAPVWKPLGKNIRSLYLTVRDELRFHTNVKLFNSIYGHKPRKDDVDLVTISEQASIPVVIGADESKTSMQLAEYAFEYAKIHERHKVSAIHEPQITTKTDALFLKCCREVANKYPEIKYEELTIEDCGILLVKNHRHLDVLVMHRFSDPIICDHCADLVGGLSFIPSCNIGEGNIALAEAVPGTTPEIDDMNLANPTPLLLSAVMMLQHLKLHDKADQIHDAIIKTIAEGKYQTADIGGTSTTKDVTKSICNHLPNLPLVSSPFITNISTSANADPSPSYPIQTTLFPGLGIGPDITESVKQVLSTAEVPIKWEEHFVGNKEDQRTKSYLTWESLESIRKNGAGIKAPMWKPIGNAQRSIYHAFREELSLYASVKLFNSLYGYKPRKNDVDIVTVTQQMRGVDESQVCAHVAEYAFYYARTHGRDKVSAIHEPEITTKTDGLFLKCCREVANKYPEIRYEEITREACVIKLATDHAYFDVLAVDRFSDYSVSNDCAALVGGLRLVPSCNIGEGGIALAEAVPGTEPDFTEKNLANPTPLLLSTVMMLHHLKLHDKADRITKAIVKTIAQGTHQTADVGGICATTCVTKAICNNI
ncbi:hypothetical protein IFM89_027323 [Coptis chinensis]|uniref:Isopropylmalate dehydrogenase-like domain-containing protein n=1 Tax=Coptis chinensis TaxID=261450 RepID=A0A835HK69_9MAGN|nr:hypothetical protein IFM89_027323 [Coptis chinensis]